jgi:pilus assembly protein FimV
MAYNKSKYVEAAQKLLNQGKVAQAIAEYQLILKYEPRDQVTLMTVGELYIRQGETFQAIDYFERLAQIFVGDGFLTKAIAVYKRIAKLAPEEIRPLEKLADLYVQQGVMSEARPLFLQLAEIHLKNNRQPEAVNLLKKLLLAEPDNLRIQIRLADLYHAMGSRKDAVETYVSAAQRALARGDQAECEKLADKALALDQQNLAAAIVKARSYSARGNTAEAAELLEKTSELEKGGEQAELLLDLYLKSSDWEKSSALALRIFEADEKNFGPVQKVTEALLQSGQSDKAMTIMERTRIAMLDAGENEAVARLLVEMTTRMPGRIEPLEWLVDSYSRTSDAFRMPDALAQLGDALVADGQLDRAKEIFEQLLDREPDSDSAKQRLHDLLRRMGHAAPEEEDASSQDNLKTELQPPPAPKLRPDIEPAAVEVAIAAGTAEASSSLDKETERFIAQSLTDVDLFASYGLTQKAIGLLEAILRRAPQHTPTLEKLLEFVIGAGDDKRSAELAARLEKIHGHRGDQLGGERFAELRRRFQRSAGLTDEQLELAVSATQTAATSEDIAVPEADTKEIPAFEIAPEHGPVVEVRDSNIPAAATEPQDIHEVDLSEEWASLMKGAPEHAAHHSPSEQTVVQSAGEPAEFAITPEAPPGEAAPEVPEHMHLASSGAPSNVPALSEFQVPEQPAAEEIPLEVSSAKIEQTPASQPAGKQSTPVEEPAEVSLSSAKIGGAQKAEEPEFEVDQDYELTLNPEPLVPAHEQRPPDVSAASHPSHPEGVAQGGANPPAGSDLGSDRFLADLANEIEGLGIGELTPSYSKADAPAPPKMADTSNRSDSGPLKEVFDEFRAELGEMGSDDEDLETHYNLGTAFREMGLLEEAISEFQKVAKANERSAAPCLV